MANKGVVFLTQLGTHQHDSSGRIGDQALDLRTHGVQVAKVERDKARAHAVATRLALHALNNRGVKGALVQDGARLARKHELDALELRRLLAAERLCALRMTLAVSSLTLRLRLSALDTVAGETGDAADLANTC